MTAQMLQPLCWAPIRAKICPRPFSRLVINCLWNISGAIRQVTTASWLLMRASNLNGVLALRRLLLLPDFCRMALELSGITIIPFVSGVFSLPMSKKLLFISPVSVPEPDQDKLRIYDFTTAQLLAEYSGRYDSASPPPPVLCPSGKVFLTFNTNGSVREDGWEAYYESYYTGISITNREGIKIYPNPAKGPLLRVLPGI